MKQYDKTSGSVAGHLTAACSKMEQAAALVWNTDWISPGLDEQASSALPSINQERGEMRRIAAVVDDIYEDLELWYPRIRMEEEGWKVVVAGPESGKLYTGKHGYPCRTDAAFADLRAAEFDALLVPGGFAPDKMRRDQRLLALVRDMHAAGKLIGFICHAGWVLISAGILRGKRATSTVGIRDDMVNAGALWVDEPLVVDGNLVSSRTPADLPFFAKGMVDWLARR